MKKLRIEEIIVVEGKYDAAKLSDIVDGLIITTDGFSIYTNEQTRDLILNLGAKRGVVVLTDSDAAGFQIRNYINNFATGVTVKNAYVPSIAGKEKRKKHAGKEGILGVEGVSAELILQALQTACVQPAKQRSGRQITYADLYEMGVSGTQGSADKRRALLHSIGLPLRLSKKVLCEVLNSLYTYEEFANICEKSVG